MNPRFLVCLMLLGCSPKPSPRAEPVAPEPPPPRKAEPAREPESKKEKPKENEPPPPPPKADNPAVTPTNAAGVVRGHVRYFGREAKPEPRFVQVNGKRREAEPPSPLRVGKGNGLADAFVWLAKAPPEAARAAPEEARLTQRLGAFHPRARFLAPGSTLKLTTGDDEADFVGEGAVTFRRALKPGASASVVLRERGLVTVRSDERPWMVPARAWVVDHDFHAVTGEDGAFELPRLPAGEYELRLWHAGWSPYPLEARAVLRLADGKGAEVVWKLP